MTSIAFLNGVPNYPGMRNQYDWFLVKNIEKVSALPKEIEIFKKFGH